MRLGFSAFEYINKKHELKVKIEKPEKAKPVKVIKDIWKVEPKKRKEMADRLIDESLKSLGTFSAKTMAQETGLTINCARSKLNDLFDKGELIREVVKSKGPGKPVFHFSKVT